MKKYISDIAFSTTVKKVQEENGSRSSYAKMEQGIGWQNSVDQRLSEFIEQRDSLYFGTANTEGQPYIQHRGGPKGFLKVLDDKTLAFADYSGNMQYITIGTLRENNKAYIFLMDYPNRTRMKLWGTAKVIDNDSKLLEKLHSTEYKAKPERAIVFTVEAWDVNCPQHIQQRFTMEELKPEFDKLNNRIKELESQLNEVSQKNQL
jgi:predicted pyridoxine 5'-phosphate oxidase superfamily flavin-nucleotide-binding protein